MKVFITGATGFIGTHLVKRLAQTEHEMYCLVRHTSRVDELKALGATPIIGDVTDKASVLEGMRGCDWVIHLANIYTFWEPDKRIYKKVNVEGTRNVMECALETGVSKVVHVSTYGVYGKPADCPFTEESQIGPVRVSEYTRTKYAGDMVAWELYEQRGLPLVVIYPSNVLGAGDQKATGQYIQDLITCRLPARVFEDMVFTAVHVRDVVDAIVKALEKENNIGEKYLIGNHRLSMREVNQMIREISGVSLPKMKLPGSLALMAAALFTPIADLIKQPPPWGMSMDQIKTMRDGFIADGSKAERELGITYTPIRVALEEAIAAYQGQRISKSKCLVVYFSQGGTTGRVAESIATGLRTAGYQVDLCNMKDERSLDLSDYDVLGIGSPVYYFRPPFNVMDYVKGLPHLNGLPTFVFVLHGTYRGDAGTAIRRALARKGAREVGYFHCRGADYYLGYLKERYLFSPNHPTVEELASAETFGREVAAHLDGKPYVRPENDRPPAAIYRLERFLTNRWLTRQVYSRLSSVDAKACTACGLCVALCPAGNITLGEDGRPTWGRDCLLCLTCEMKCPEDAVTSPVDWPLFRPFMLYNVRHAAQDPALDHVRVTHSHGRTKRV